MKQIDFEAIKTLDPNAVFSVGEAARLLGLTHNGMLLRMKRGQIKSGRSGGRYFIPGSEIQRQIVLPNDNV